MPAATPGPRRFRVAGGRSKHSRLVRRRRRRRRANPLLEKLLSPEKLLDKLLDKVQRGKNHRHVKQRPVKSRRARCRPRRGGRPFPRRLPLALPSRSHRRAPRSASNIASSSASLSPAQNPMRSSRKPLSVTRPSLTSAMAVSLWCWKNPTIFPPNSTQSCTSRFFRPCAWFCIRPTRSQPQAVAPA